ncbi:MAG: TRAP transporter permease [Clostridia bacterium]|nr:TRAP transporter permease [Clostridia bacterium]MBQ4338210.1 TRAP transporter permease [Clostridia bacterium]
MSDVNTKPISMEADEEIIDVDKIMADFDKESNTRHFGGIFQKIIKIAMVLFSLYVMVDGWFGTMEERQKMAWFIGIIVFFAFIIYPVHKKEKKRLNHVPFYDWILAAVGAGSFFYYAINCQAIVDRASRINEIDIAVAIVGTVLLFEACRRVVGLPIVCVSAAFIAYAFIVVDRSPLRVIMHRLFYTTEGIAGTPLNVCASFIVLFIIFASFLEQSGIGAFFVDLANSIAGKATGGPAKVAVISSAMEGMYSGSSVANTVGSGSVTIPTMKRCGYKPEFAAAVEAAASTGGQIMPPIMGAAAFLMTEYTGMPYSQIAIAAILPAVLYFTGIFMMIHFEAKKLGLKGLPKESIPNFFKLVISKGYLLLPVIALVVAMNYFSPAKAAITAILVAIGVKFIEGAVKSIVHKKFEFDFSLYIQSLANGTKNAIGVALACAVAGCISAMVQQTGLANVLSSLVQSASQIHPIFALALTMLMCIVLGMGVPTTANYVIMASMVAPILMRSLSIPVLAAHMFVFYFGIVADITPPVALAAYAGSAIAKSNPLKTGVTATRLAITAFIVPYIFAFSPEMLIVGSDKPWYEIVLLVVTALCGIYIISAGMEGYMYKHMPWWERILALAGGLCMIIPGIATDLVGVALIVLVFILQKIGAKKQNKITA